MMNTCDSATVGSRWDGHMKLVTHTTGGTSATVAMKSQARPLQTQSASADRKNRGVQAPHLSPHEVSQTIYPRFVEAQAEQANEHDEK